MGVISCRIQVDKGDKMNNRPAMTVGRIMEMTPKEIVEMSDELINIAIEHLNSLTPFVRSNILSEHGMDSCERTAIAALRARIEF